MTEKIGVYVCECGPNIKDAMDLETVVKFAQDLEGVVFAKTFRTLCSEDGKNLITLSHGRGWERPDCINSWVGLGV